MTDDRWVEHWSASADRVDSNSRFLLGECSDGDWYVRRIWRDVYRPVEWWNPLHWLAYLGSRLGRRLAWLEFTR